MSGPQRGLTLRSFVVCIFALFLMGIWHEYQVVLLVGGPFLENSPPNGAVCVIMIVLLISALLYTFRRPLGLITPELVVIYTALLVAAPLMTQGMWTRIFGIIAALPHEQDFRSYENLPSVLWPHGNNLITNGRFTAELQQSDIQGTGKLGYEDILWRGKKVKSPVLDNGNDEKARTWLTITLPRWKNPGTSGQRELLTPRESYLFSCLVRASGFQTTSYYYVKTKVDDGMPYNLLLGSAETAPTFDNQGGFLRIGRSPVNIPSDLKQTYTILIGLNGPGKLAIQDVEFFNSQAVEGAYTGAKVIRASKLKLSPEEGGLPDNERDFTFVKPDNMFSLAGIKYLCTGFIPLQQWVRPIIAWTLLIGALFMGFFGSNVLMRKQWVDSERFTFPMNILPRQLFGEDAQDIGTIVQRLVKNKVLWIGFAVMMPLVLLRGLHFYYPALPNPGSTDMWGGGHLDTFFTNPLLKAFFQNAGMAVVFSVLSIGLLLETDILFSIWVSFFLFQLWFVFGQAFNFTRYAGYPWQNQQGIGSFIAYAFLAIFAARRHLGLIFRHLIGKIKLDDAHEIVSYRTAALMVAGSLLVLLAWGVWTKMGWLASLLYFGWMLVCGLTASKIRAEAGMPFGYWSPYFGMLLVSALGGFAVFGPTGMLVATIASGFMCVACFLFIAPVQVEMMELGRHFNVRPRDIGHGLTIGLLGGILIGGFCLLCWAYGMGADNFVYSWPFKQGWYFNNFRGGELATDQLFAAGKLLTPQTAPLDFVHNIDAKGLGIGFVITCVLAFLRNAFMWFPLHPLGYVLSTTNFAITFWYMAFIAWLVRIIVLRIGGAHTIRKGLVPFSVGMFLACMVSIMIFEIVGLYLRAHGVTYVYSQWP